MNASSLLYSLLAGNTQISYEPDISIVRGVAIIGSSLILGGLINMIYSYSHIKNLKNKIKTKTNALESMIEEENYLHEKCS